MKPETDPITDEEWLIRLVYEDRFTTPTISPNSFEPRDGKHPDTDGLSLFRQSCLKRPEDALAVVAEDKRSRYGIVRIPVTLLPELGFTVTPQPIDTVPGHVVLPELNNTDYKARKAHFAPLKLRLAEVASLNILRRPEQANPD